MMLVNPTWPSLPARSRRHLADTVTVVQMLASFQWAAVEMLPTSDECQSPVLMRPVSIDYDQED